MDPLCSASVLLTGTVIRIRVEIKSCIRIRNETNADPQHWYFPSIIRTSSSPSPCMQRRYSAVNAARVSSVWTRGVLLPHLGRLPPQHPGGRQARAHVDPSAQAQEVYLHSGPLFGTRIQIPQKKFELGSALRGIVYYSLNYLLVNI
jgi:hypothetical protein